MGVDNNKIEARTLLIGQYIGTYNIQNIIDMKIKGENKMTDTEKLLDLLNDLKNLKRRDCYHEECTSWTEESPNGEFVYWDEIEDIIKKYEER